MSLENLIATVNEAVNPMNSTFGADADVCSSTHASLPAVDEYAIDSKCPEAALILSSATLSTCRG
jgi:hypothetical protein